jgi:beta-lactamase superfamily II metal-dependent hydrolase
VNTTTAVASVFVLGAAILGNTQAVAEDEASTASTFTLWQLPNQTPTQMMSYVIRTVNGKVIVIDGGNAGDAPYLREFIKKQGDAVEAWFITHPHSDHYNALATLLPDLGGMTIKTFYGSMPDDAWVKQYANEEELKTFTAFKKAVADAGREVTELELGQKLDIDGVHIEVLGIRNPEITANCINNSSMVMRVWDDAKSVLFTGDLGPQGGDKLLNGPYADRLPSDYCQMAHHGQNGVNEAFYQKVNPTYCLWPAPKWLWDNDNGGGKGSGPWKTLEVRAWMEKLPIKAHYILPDGLVKIE